LPPRRRVAQLRAVRCVASAFEAVAVAAHAYARRERDVVAKCAKMPARSNAEQNHDGIARKYRYGAGETTVHEGVSVADSQPPRMRAGKPAR